MKNLLFASVAFMLFFACSNETVFEEKDDSTIDVVTKSINDNGPFNLHDWRIEVIGAIMYHGFDMGPYWSDYESKGKTTFLTGPLTIEETIAQFGGCVGYNILGLTDISNWLYSYNMRYNIISFPGPPDDSNTESDGSKKEEKTAWEKLKDRYEGAAFIEENNYPPGSSFTYAQAAAIMARMDKQKDDEFLPFVYIKAYPSTSSFSIICWSLYGAVNNKTTGLIYSNPYTRIASGILEAYNNHIYSGVTCSDLN